MTACSRTLASAPPVEHLILDLGGVILPSAMPQVISELAGRSARSEQQLWRFFNTHIFETFWSGRMDIGELDIALSGYAGVPPATSRWSDQTTRSLLRPLPHAGRVREWARRVPVGVLSNQRAEWALPALEAAGLAELLDPLLISSRTGFVKPDPRAFTQLTRLGPPPARVLYVDDRPQALHTAAGLGISTLAADPGHAWVGRVDARLGVAPHDAGRVDDACPGKRLTAPGPR
jgi:putative hydrolase of the HAD superfamily